MSQFQIDVKEVLADAEPEPVEEPVEVSQDRVFRQTCSRVQTVTKPVVPPVVEPAPQSIVPKPTEPNPELENEEEE